MDDVKVGDKVWFEGETQGYMVQARNERFVVCTKFFNVRRIVLYTIVDLQEKERGTDGYVGSLGYETREDCEEALSTFTDGGIFHKGGTIETHMGVSRRNHTPLRVTRVQRA